VKISNAISQKAAGVLMYDVPGNTVLFRGGIPELAPFPCFSMGNTLGISLANMGSEGRVSMYANNSFFIANSANIIADTNTGNGNYIITSGSHLDSVEEGPGINDDGSGSATNLEIALNMARLSIRLNYKVRFCWWGAEEYGLIGSTYYVTSLPPDQLNKIALNLNFDMIGSPNFIMGIYNGTSGGTASGNIQSVFQQYFDCQQINTTLVPFDGRSDYGPFLAAGIPAGGLFTGAEVIKTVQDYELFGGVIQVAFDPCYHLSCDTVDNINQVALLSNAKAAAYTIQYLANQNDLTKFLASTN